MIDLRSDTLTKPTPGMLEFMMGAEVGDDILAKTKHQCIRRKSGETVWKRKGGFLPEWYND